MSTAQEAPEHAEHTQATAQAGGRERARQGRRGPGDGGADALPGPRRPRWRAAAGWLPAAFTLLLVAGWLRRFGVSPGDMVVFAGYIAIAVTLPGTLLYRALTGRSRHLAEDLAAGTALGYAVEVLTYIAARWAGAPRLFLIWPVATIGAFLLVPALRRHWRGGTTRLPLWWSWSAAAIAGLATLASSAEIFHAHPVGGGGATTPDVHMLFHLALTNEVRHHVPPVVPWVAGEPLRYHWFACAEMAATRWATGLSPETLLYRLSMLPMMAAFPVLLAALAYRLSGRRWTGPAVLVITYLLVSPAPAAWTSLLDSSLLSQANRFAWLSPSQTFGTLLFGALMLVLVRALRVPRGVQGAAPWATVAVLMAAVMGAKATYLLMLLCGLLAVAAKDLLRHRFARRRGLPVHGPWVSRPVAIALGLTAAFTVFAQLVLFGGASQGMEVAPGATLRFIATQTLPDFAQLDGQGVVQTLVTSAVTLLIVALGWVCVWSGLTGFARRPRLLADPGILLVLTVGFAGIGALLVLSSLGLSQFYFARGSYPYAALAAVCGMSVLLPVPLRARPAGGRRRQRRVPPAHAAALGALALGTLLAVALPVKGTPAPFVLLCEAVIAAGLLAGGIRSLGRPGALSLMAIVLCALTLPATVRRTAHDLAVVWSPDRSGYAGQEPISDGGLEAARWLRDHSRPDDLVATNAHCVHPAPARCNNQHLWISAVSERRVLVEGWGLTETANSMGTPGDYPYTPFWDRRRLADNDAVFHDPSARALSRLRRHHGVGWLFADASAGRIAPDLARLATLRFQRDDCSVYELPR